MRIEDFIHIATLGVQTAIMVSAPVLLMGLAAGLLVSIFQAATQINDAALAFIPKILAATTALVIFGPWMISQMVAFSTMVFNEIPRISG